MSIASMVSHSPQAITVTLQYGSSKELIVVERSQDPHAFELFRQKARQMAERHRLESGAPGGAGAAGLAAPLGELHLFVHDYNSAQMLQHLSSLAQLENGCVVEIIRIERNERPTRPHCLQVLNYKTPTFCDYCGEILVGLIKQGLQCSQCKCNFHKKCAFAPRNNCAKNELIPNTFLATAGFMQAGGDLQQLHQQTTMQSPQAFAMPHTLSVHNYKTPTVCKVCDKLLLGLMKQGLRCRDCKVNVHKKCANQLPMNCQLTEGAVTNNFDQMSVSDASSQNLMDMETVADNGSHVEATDSMIPLARLP
ncbi:CAMK/PKD protein kinase, partial [Aphelenchoides avenae]